MKTFKEWTNNPLITARVKIFGKPQNQQNFLFSSVWTGREAIEKHLGLKPEEVEALFAAGIVAPTKNGYLISKEKLHSLGSQNIPSPPSPSESKEQKNKRLNAISAAKRKEELLKYPVANQAPKPPENPLSKYRTDPFYGQIKPPSRPTWLP